MGFPGLRGLVSPVARRRADGGLGGTAGGSARRRAYAARGSGLRHAPVAEVVGELAGVVSLEAVAEEGRIAQGSVGRCRR